MSDSQRPPQRNNRPRRELQNNQPRSDYQPQDLHQEAPPQGRPMPPQAPPPNYSLPLNPQQPQQQAPQVIIQQKGNNPLVTGILGIFYVILFPFIKIVQFLGWFLKLIVQELLRSVISFIIGLVLLIAVIVFMIGYGVALVNVEFDVVAAFPEMMRIFSSLIGMGGA